MGVQRRIRELAFQMLFQLDLGMVDLQRLESEFLPGVSATEEMKRKSLEKTAMIWKGLPQIDAHLREYSENWDLARMAAADRNILRLAAGEILLDPSVPKAVAIDEAVEMAKRYSTRESGAFVNGILDRLEKPS